MYDVMHAAVYVFYPILHMTILYIVYYIVCVKSYIVIVQCTIIVVDEFIDFVGGLLCFLQKVSNELIILWVLLCAC